MILILCDNWRQARIAFQSFLDIIDASFDRECVQSINRFTNCVETDTDLRYIFCDFRFAGVLLSLDRCTETVDVYDFFDDCELPWNRIA